MSIFEYILVFENVSLARYNRPDGTSKLNFRNANRDDHSAEIFAHDI